MCTCRLVLLVLNQEKKEKAQKEAQAAAASMESASNIPTQQTTEVIPPQAAPQSAPSASDDLLALDANPFQAKADNVLSISAAQQNNSQLWSNQNILDPMCELLVVDGVHYIVLFYITFHGTLYR